VPRSRKITEAAIRQCEEDADQRAGKPLTGRFANTMGLILRVPRGPNAPFIPEEFAGHFCWDARLSELLGGRLYHGCHEKELATALAAGMLPLRSDWAVELPEFGTWTAKGVWAGLNDYFGRWNHFGPCLVTLPIKVLDGRQFLVFRRPSSDRRSVYTFVQHDSPLPDFLGTKEAWREVCLDKLFQVAGAGLKPRGDDGYRVVLTTPLPLTDATFRGVTHPPCAYEGCAGATPEEAAVIVERRLAGVSRSSQRP
jgi:hypothetical protein